MFSAKEMKSWTRDALILLVRQEIGQQAAREMEMKPRAEKPQIIDTLLRHWNPPLTGKRKGKR